MTDRTRMTQILQMKTDKRILKNLLHPYYLCSFIFVFLFSFSLFASDDFPPRSNRLVTDYSGTLSSAEQEQLESKLVGFNNTTSTQIAVVIMKSIGGYEVGDYAVQLGNKWGIGQKGKNNGILVLLAMESHDVSIQIGYGLEGAAPDVIASRIIRNEMVPYFKQGDFYTGLDKGTDALMSAVKGEYTADEKVRGQKFPWFIIFIIFFIIVISMGAQVSRTRNYSRINHIPFWTAWFLLSQARGKQRGSWGNFSSGRGGFGGGGGGFGGFGGGGFGGGGASGSW